MQKTKTKKSNRTEGSFHVYGSNVATCIKDKRSHYDTNDCIRREHPIFQLTPYTVVSTARDCVIEQIEKGCLFHSSWQTFHKPWCERNNLRPKTRFETRNPKKSLREVSGILHEFINRYFA